MISRSHIMALFNSVRRAIFVGIALGATSGCSIFPTVPPETLTIARQHTAPELEKVPFFPQEEYQCGPAALATILNYEGSSIQPDALIQEVYVPERKGSLQLEMLAATRRQGYLAYPLEPDLPVLLKALEANKPVLVLMNLSLQIAPVWHYAVVVGYNPNTDQVALRSGLQKRDEMSLATFLKLWGRADNWAFVALKPNEQPPAFAQAGTYLDATVALERTNLGNAVAAYKQGVATWPDNHFFQFGLGNSLYQGKQYAQAESAYQQSVKLKPDFADGWNNLAEVLWTQNKKTQARQAIQKAIALAGERLPQYQETAKKMGVSP